MIEKMKFLSITGPKEDIDRVVDQYLSKYEIQIENALSELKTVKDLRPYIEINPYKDSYQKATKLAGYFKEAPKSTTTPADRSLSIEEAVRTVKELDRQLAGMDEKKEQLEKALEILRISYGKVLPFEELDYDLRTILHFNFIRFRFGRIPREYYTKFENYVYDSLDTVFYKCHEDANYISAVYFVPASISKRIDAIYASMHFERFFIPDEYNGTPTEAIEQLRREIDRLEAEEDALDASISKVMNSRKDDLMAACHKLSSYNTNFNVRKLAACTRQDINTFYILCGWMTEKDALAFQEELKQDEQTFCIVEDDHNNILSQPPTKLKNPWLFKPFEMFIKMYGLPAYNEMDPTILLALTYSILFGFMFGDVGQGFCLLAGGLLLYRLKKMNLAAIISCCGFFSTIFGFLFGSVFGFETLEPIWLRPAEQMMNLPFIGRLNTVFAVAIALGMGIIILTMILNIVNSFRQHDREHSLFDTNGIAGLVFYVSLTAVLVLYMTGHALPATSVLVVMFIIPLIIIFLKEPLTALVNKESKILPESKAMYLVQGFFELFEVLLSYFSNTLSFVRVGAFAVSHAAMMNVVMMLAGAEAGGSPDWLIVVFGNLFVCAMEGLIVGIQVLRLEYYEIFSRFYKGSGREFKPYGRDV